MDSKLAAAQIAMKAGCGVVIAGGRKKNVLSDVMAGKNIGTLLLSNVL
jgi:glutamate 5-kinase